MSADFLKTARRNIISIQRVQNPTLYKQYLLKKKGLDAKNGSCEKWLFHGTAGNNLQKINESGLNRSFAGNSHGKSEMIVRSRMLTYAIDLFKCIDDRKRIFR